MFTEGRKMRVSPSVLVAMCTLPTQFGTFDFHVHRVGRGDKSCSPVEVCVLASQNRASGAAVPVRIHDACFTSETLHSQRCDCAEQLVGAMAHIQDHGGLVLYMQNEGRGIGLVQKIRAYSLQETLGLDTYEANGYLGLPDDARSYEAVPAVLSHYNVHDIVLLTNNARKREKLQQVGVRVSSCVPVLSRPRLHNSKYLRAKDRYNIVPHRPLKLLGAQVDPFDAVSQAVEAFRNGQPVIVLDDPGRENEGDLIIPAVHTSTESVAFMLRHTSGVICCALSHDRAVDLKLLSMVEDNEDGRRTAFTVSVDFQSSTTGISARERADTCRALADAGTTAADLRRPGHVFPLVAKPGGVKERAGHAEAGVDLCRLANLPECAVLSEIVTEDKSEMARGDELEWLAHKHGLPILTIEQMRATM